MEINSEITTQRSSIMVSVLG